MTAHVQRGLFVCLLLSAWPPARAQEWTRFRGPNGTGHSTATTIPTKWTESDFRWKVSLPGAGHSSPVIWGETVFLTSADDQLGRFFVLGHSVDDGHELWRREFAFTPFAKHKFNSFASATPAVDAERLYVAWTTPARFTLAAFDHAGKPVWEKDLGPSVSQHNGGASPIVYEGKVIIANEQDGDSSLLAVDAKSGATIWQTPRKTTRASYSTPCVYEPPGGKPVLIFNSQSHGISAIDPVTGSVVWEFASAFDKRSVSSPVIAAGLILGSCGQGGGAGNFAVAVRPGDPASGKPAEAAWHLRRSSPYVPTSVVVGDHLFMWSDMGILSRVHAPTGEVKWQERVGGGDYFGSPVCIDGRLFNVSASGEVVVVAAAEKFEVLARNSLGELCHSTPAVAGGKLFIRAASRLFCIGGKSPEAASR
jgi:outer membrane protein assembly factor BamB